MLSLPATTTFLGLAAWFASALVLGLLARSVFQASRLQAGWSRASRYFMWASMVALAIFLLRPHEHTWQGLDSSAYRLMAKAFVEGRPLHDMDHALMEVPPDLRKWTLLLPSMNERDTRDRSFEIPDVETGQTQPFFQPLFSLAMAGFDACVPGPAMDYFLPMVGLAFMAACLLASAGTGGLPGIFAAWALLLGSPLLAWMFRGGFAEAAGGAFLAMAWLAWITQAAPRNTPWAGYLALGLSVSFHPVFIVLAVPSAGIFFLMDASGGRLKRFAGLLVFAVALIPFYLSTQHLAQPYGQIFQWSSLAYNFQVSASHRVAITFIAIGAVLFLALGIMRDALADLMQRPALTRAKRLMPLALPLLWAAPTFVAATLWSEKGYVLQGLYELWQGLQWPFGLVLGVGILLSLVLRQGAASRWAISVAFFCLPVFLYLKGAEQMGFWSQRRLLPPLLLLITAIIPLYASWLRDLYRGFSPYSKTAATMILGLIMAAGLSNPVRWPAPYIVRYEQGADQWLEQARERIGGRLLFVDYHPWSVPLAVDNRTRVVGLSEFGAQGFPAMVEWLGGRSAQEDVWWMTAYSNPGLEDGIVLESMGREAQTFQRLRSKHALPAVRVEYVVDVDWIRVRPMPAEGQTPAMRKVFDRGPAGLRGPWGSMNVRLVDDQGRALPAAWSREGSGIIGPVPEPGGRVRFIMQAASYQETDAPDQVMLITPPWADKTAGSLVIGQAFTKAEVVLERPLKISEPVGKTGTYRLNAQKPYDPSTRDIHGFHPDLGVLVHFIGIEIMND